MSLSGIIFWCLCSRLFHCQGGLPLPSLFIFQNPSRVFFHDPPGISSVFFCYLCLSGTLVFVHWCVPSIQNSALHIVGAQLTLVKLIDGVHFYILIIYGHVCFSSTVWGQESCLVIVTCSVPDKVSQKHLNGRQASLASGASILEARESFPYIAIICIKSWVYGQDLSCGFMIRWNGIPECWGVRTMP